MERVFRTIKERADMLADTRWSYELTWGEMETVAEYMETYRAARGSVIFREGAKESYMCIVVEGSVSILKDDEYGKPKKITTLGPGNFIGEMSPIDGSPRSATATAEKDTLLLVLTGEQFDLMVARKPLLGVKIIKKIASVLSQRLRQTSGVLVDYIEVAV